MMDEKWMKLAIEMARSTMGQTSPNPAVGAVVVNHGRAVGMGAHLKPGEGHAEVHALKQAGDQAAGGTIYVTLEPCSHYGKTPPCADLIIEKKLARVVVASVDPNPLVAGKGLKKLEEAGLEVTVGVLKEEALQLNEFFFHHTTAQRPFVTLKAAMTLDGKIATSSGSSKWITSEEAREDVHLDRHLHDAILVGANTVKQDNPSLTARLRGEAISPVRIVLDTLLSIPEASAVLTDEASPTWVICGSDASEEKERLFAKAPHVRVIRMSGETIELPELLTVLGKEKILSLYVEGGAKVHGAFLDQKAVDRIVMYIAPKIIGSSSAFSVFNGKGVEAMSEAVGLTIKDVKTIGQDIKITAALS
ncbi:bifunctional diaminohydroxyphosphoribosylaminopyrimidine deaminase/5-amino-6-(5-phosphoribosylamino)uracil reductase RibD [Jeotgalibacillus sp. ET6]|uniref:bifunctional diaminohydroxyphosphoribosylaminopyrimidine deaminase/5-amino-6-(5-phosphoribosylamino)uracil reductase RibD n=1 Tax=Jeotgalibacillus sp. ET6 TaxID=3037260 RepID=UPI0024182630|nr:bifunctional diaminohydroxyphosphoribosylaminopyrimidine deaminase/5-amino-6-(5-phosphoribosylamino)uracil reductase RibD [Jeotgalibacillus sp. ET6]MDG5470513.1 bifunctional diaminohydroxyphosphoribosylaminopyrimidine deaminase/5-amino-6-(5-phosphoribosylamino)uracil reductase RibD [Jeotgalibacillus sp. ET6]